MKPSESVWPTFGSLSAGNPVLLTRFTLDPGSLRTLAAVAGLLALYVAGLYAPIPALQPRPAGPPPWWFLRLFDQLFTGGAFDRGALFALGLFASLSFGNPARPFWRRLLAHGVLTVLALAVYLTRLPGSLGPATLAATFALLYFGGIAVVFLNRWLVRKGGPQILYVNILLLFGQHFRDVVAQLVRQRDFAVLAAAGAGIVLLSVSAVYVFRTRIFFEVENIKSMADRRSVTLEIRGVDESSLDQLGLTSVILFLSLSGVVSLFAGWRDLAAARFAWVAAISGAVFLLVAFLLVLTRRFLTAGDSVSRYARQVLEAGELSKLHDPYRYAMQMLNHFWIVPGTPAGRETERFIEDKLTRVMRRSFLIFTLWFVTTLLIQLWADRRGAGVLLFPYGPLVFISLFLMCIGYLSALGHRLRSELNNFKQIARGKSRLMAQSFPRPAAAARPLDLEVDADYWREEKTTDQMREILDWYRLLQQGGVRPGAARAARRPRLYGAVSKVVIALLSGVLFAFIGGSLFVLLFPKSDDLGGILISLFMAGAFSPNVFWTLLAIKRKKAA